MGRGAAVASLVLPGLIIYLLIVSRLTLFDIVAGAALSTLSAAIVAHLLVRRPSKALNPLRALALIAYGLYLLFVVEPKCHYDVIRRYLGRSLDIRPGIIEVPYEVSDDYAVTCVASSITNTPGTVVVDVDEGRRAYYVHKLYVTTVEPSECRREVSEVFERWAKRVFGGE